MTISKTYLIIIFLMLFHIGYASGIEELLLKANGQEISNGSNQFSLDNHTDFGELATDSSKTYSYQLINNGNNNITITSLNIEEEKGNDFSISPVSLPLSIAPGSTFDFDITYTRNTDRIPLAKVSITSNSTHTPDYSFYITAGATCTTCYGKTADHPEACNGNGNCIT